MPKGKTPMRAAGRVLNDRKRTKAEVAALQKAGSDSGTKAMRAATVKMRRITGGGSVLPAMGVVGQEIEDRVREELARTDHTHTSRVGASVEVEKSAILDIVGGAAPSVVAEKYQLHANYVQDALKRRFGNATLAKQALSGMVLENAMACQMIAAERMHELSAAQAVVSGAVLIDKALALEKSMAEQPKTVDFAALADMGRTLKVLREISVESVAVAAVVPGASEGK